LAAATEAGKAQLGEATFAARHEAGVALSLGDAVAFAQTVAARMQSV